MTNVVIPRMPPVRRGFYRHYKGGIYWVHGLCESHATDGAPSVLSVSYESTQSAEDGITRTRPVAEFEEIIDYRTGNPPTEDTPHSCRMPRFERVPVGETFDRWEP